MSLFQRVLYVLASITLYVYIIDHKWNKISSNFGECVVHTSCKFPVIFACCRLQFNPPAPPPPPSPFLYPCIYFESKEQLLWNKTIHINGENLKFITCIPILHSWALYHLCSFMACIVEKSWGSIIWHSDGVIPWSACLPEEVVTSNMLRRSQLRRHCTSCSTWQIFPFFSKWKVYSSEYCMIIMYMYQQV